MPHRPNNEPTALYRLYDADDNLLYLGISFDPDSRLKEHQNEKHWAHLVVRRTVDWYSSRPNALSAEAAATAVEKPLHDSSWRKTATDGRPQWLNPEGRTRVEHELAAEIEKGLHWLGKVFMSGAVAQRFNVARPTASSALGALQELGLLKRVGKGRFSVTKGPAREDLETESGEAREDRQLRRAYQIWTVAELREAMKDLPDDTLISARLAGRPAGLPGQGAAGNAGTRAPF